MAIHECRDGRRRMFLRVEFSLSAEDLVNNWIANKGPTFVDDYTEIDNKAMVAEFENASRAKIIRTVREELERNGAETASYYVGDNGLSDVADEIYPIAKARFFGGK